MRILLVEDDEMIGIAIQDALLKASYAVDWVQDGEKALSALSFIDYDLMLLDIGLPLKNGIEVLRTLRSQEKYLPVLIITAKDQLHDRIIGLDAGADDYLIKPFYVPELMARLRALIRRNNGKAAPILSNGIITLDSSTREVTINNQPNIQFMLSNKEYALLEQLLIKPGAILSRGELETRIYGWGYEVESNAIEFLIHGLRKKLGKEIIQNLRGLGWRVAKPI
ncbi:MULTISPECIES: response regulator [Acinetobacter]|jgi:two-component system OmpR family response regulator|uniref:response regulator n=1 Tax=Acinetobacter TaxID=469 RepID=UPI000DE60471|nr:response regulator transcription factor [Acinetobacter nosocomialis]RSN86836.1 DNA-binding response regulator [Acinetobacter nosocomialis]SSO13265.1 Putative two-component response regulator [Acinetobacter nosocomialis]SSQ58079.1 Putative two-component response regulator [Acinetobacter nosocomialis]